MQEAPRTWASATLRHLRWSAKRLVAVRARSIPKQQGANPHWEGTLFKKSAMGTQPVPCSQPALLADKLHVKPEMCNNVSWGGPQVFLVDAFQGIRPTTPAQPAMVAVRSMLMCGSDRDLLLTAKVPPSQVVPMATKHTAGSACLADTGPLGGTGGYCA